MSEAFQEVPQSNKKPTRLIDRRPHQTSDIAGRPLSLRQTNVLVDEALENEISETMAAAVKSVERHECLAKTAAEISREQSTLARVPERSIEDLIGRLGNLWANRQKLSFFDFAGKRAVDEQIKRTEDQLARAKENRRFEAKSIVAQKLREVAPIKDLSDSVVEFLTPFEAEMAAKQLEVNSLSAINPFHWRRRSRLQEEISVLKKKIAGEKIAAALKGKE